MGVVRLLEEDAPVAAVEGEAVECRRGGERGGGCSGGDEARGVFGVVDVVEEA